MRCNQRCDHAAFAVAKESGFLGVNFLAGFQVSEGRFDVAGKIFGRRTGVISGGLADTTLIEAKNSDAFSRQVVRQHEKRAMSNESFISIVRAGTAEENGSGKRPLPARNSERAREGDLRFSVREGDFFFLVRLRFCGVLR